MHDWRDATFDWPALESALDLLRQAAARGRIQGEVKEKWGTARWYVHWWDGTAAYFLPRHWRQQIPRFARSIDNYLSPLLTYYTGVWWLGRQWQRYCYREGYARAVTKFPHVAAEILCAADHSDLLKGIIDGTDSDSDVT